MKSLKETTAISKTIKNKKLYDALTAIGIQIKSAGYGEFDDALALVLPSGRRKSIDFNDYFCNCDDNLFDYHDCLSSWLMEIILKNGETASGEIDEELTAIISKGFLLDSDWKIVDILSKIEDVMSDLFGDDTVEEAIVEQACGYEGGGWLSAAKIKDGKRIRAEYISDEELEAEDCEGLTFVVTGNLKYFENHEAIVEYIEEAGGTVSESVSQNTDYLICNNINSNSSNMKKAKALGITVLTEAAFIRRFGDPDEFEGLKDPDELYEEFWKYTYSSGSMKFMIENGLSPIYMEVWKDGKWVSASEDKK